MLNSVGERTTSCGAPVSNLLWMCGFYVFCRLCSRAGLITVLLVAMSVSFCLPHHVAVSAFIMCRGLCACTEIVRMCVLYASFGCKIRPRTYGCVAMGSALLCIFRSRLLVYSTESGVNRLQVVLSGFSMRSFCPGKYCM